MLKFISIMSFAFFLSMAGVQAQSTSGLQVYSGYLAGLNSNKDFSPTGVRGGYFAGADARLLGGDMYFLIGGRFNVMSLNASSAPGFSSDTYSFFSGRIGVGFTILNISRNIRLRSKFLGSVHLLNTIEEEKIDNPRFTEVNDSYGGLVTGLGVDIGFITADLEYEYGVINSVFKEPDTKISFLTLSVGFKF